MKKLNVRWLGGLLFGSVAFAILTLTLHHFQLQRNSAAFLRQARRSQESNHPEEAAEHFRRYVALAPNDSEGLILYGIQLADLGRRPAAYLTLEKAVRRSPERIDVRRRLVGLGLSLGQFAEAKDQLQHHLLVGSPQDTELLEQLSTCEIALGRYGEAETILESIISEQPTVLNTYIRLASLLREKLNRSVDANRVMDRMVAGNPSNYRAYVHRGQWLKQRERDLKDALKLKRSASENEIADLRTIIESDCRRALELAPDDAATIEFAARVSKDDGRVDEARKHVLRGIELHPKNARFYTLLADIEALSANSKAALVALRQGAAVAPQDQDLQWNFANSLIDAGELVEAKEVIAGLRRSKYPTSLVQFIEAKMFAHRGEWISTIQQLEVASSGLREYPSVLKQANWWLGIAYRETLSREQQLVSFRRAVTLDPDWIPARVALAESLVSSNLVHEGIDEYKQVLLMPGAPAAATLGLAKSLLLMNLRKPLKQQSWDEFDELLSKIEKLGMSPTQIAIFRMEKLLGQENREGAEEIIANAREKYPEQIELWVADIGLAQLRQDWNRVDRLIEETIAKFGDTENLRMVQGRRFVQQLGAKAGERLRAISEPNPRWTEQERIQHVTNFASLYASIGEFDEAAQLAAQISRLEPANLRVRLILMDIAMRAKKPQLLEQVLEEVRHVTAEGAIWHYGEAVRQILLEQETKDPEASGKALSHLEKARAAQPTWDRPALLAAEIYERRGELAASVEAYLEAIRLGERSSAVASRTLSLLFKEKRFDDADKLIRRLRESQSLFTDEIARAEVDISLRLGRKFQALKSAEELVRTSQQAQDPNWLGQVYASLEKYDLSEQQFRLAAKSNPKDPRSWISLVQVLVLSKQLEKTEAVIEEARAAIPASELPLAIGQCYESMGKLDLARSSYEAAMRQAPTDFAINRKWVEFLFRTGATPDAEFALRNMIKEANRTDELSRRKHQWADRKLASALVVRGSRDQLNEALAIIDRYLDTEGEKSVEDLRLKAVILARDPSRKIRQQAIVILEALLSQKGVSATANDDRFLLANLYSMTDERAKARAELRKLIAASKDDPRYLAAYAQLCLQAKETNEAGLYVDALQKVAPGELTTIDLESQVLFAKGKYLELEELLKTTAVQSSRTSARGQNPPQLKLWVAKRLEKFGRLLGQVNKADEASRFNSESESFYKQFVQERPEEILAIAEFLAQTNQVDRCLEILEKHGADAKPWQVASVASVVMRSAQVTNSQLDHLQGLLKSRVQSSEKSLPLLLATADLMAWRCDVVHAIETYRELLRSDNRSIPALNNLAYLMAVSATDHGDALTLVQRAIDHGGAIDSLLDTRGLAYLAAGRPEKALTDLNQAISENDTAERRFHVAIALMQLQQTDSARQSLELAESKGLSEKSLHPLERASLTNLREKLKSSSRLNSG